MKNLLILFLLSLVFACNSVDNSAELAALQTELEAVKKQLAEATSMEAATPGMMHNVFFWLKEDLSEADEQAFVAGIKSLQTISAVKSSFIGPPASTEARDVVDNTYSYALLLHFADVEGQNAYQVDPIHLQFVEDHKDKWTKVIVYDNAVMQ